MLILTRNAHHLRSGEHRNFSKFTKSLCTSKQLFSDKHPECGYNILKKLKLERVGKILT